MKIAIVEDMAMMVSLWYQYLEETRHELQFFTSKPGETEELADFAPDLIVLSGRPTGQTVSSLAGILTSRPGIKEAAIVAVSGRESASFVEKWRAESIDAVLINPFDRQNVLGLVDRYDSRDSDRRTLPLAVVVDDNTVSGEILKKEMEELGFRVDTASSAKGGYDKILSTLPDIALIDIEMAGSGGLDLCRDVASNPKTFRLPTIMISRAVCDRDIRKGFDSGAIDYLPKPVESSRLANAVFSAMGRRQKVRRYAALVLEDDKSIASVIAKRFDDLGVVTRVCRTSAELLSHLDVSIPDIVTLNLTPPDCSGLELCRTLCKRNDLDRVSVVVISTANERDSMKKCLRHGASDVIEKPFSKEEFDARVGNLIKMRQLKDELSRQNQTLERLSYYDRLTRLLNRRYLDENLHKEAERADRSETPLGIMMVDLDLFGDLLDRQGFEVGDEVLREVSAIIRQNIRPIDIPCRYDVQRICVLLPGCNLDETAKVAERIRLVCDSESLSNQVRQTLSIGVSAFPSHSSKARLIPDADGALSEAQAGGRNRVVSVRAGR